MSLVVARHTGSDIRIIGDTRFTSSMVIHRDLLAGGLKAIIATPTCCVCFSGDVGSAECAIAPVLARAGGSRDHILAHLLACHRDSNREVDFLVAFADGRPHLSRICEGELQTDLSSAWIGDHSAFGHYQKIYHGLPQPPAPMRQTEEHMAVAQRMDSAFTALLDSHSHATVGDFQITATSQPAEQDGFRYLFHQRGSGFKEVSGTTEPTSLLRPVGPEGGGFRYSVLVPSRSGVGAVGVYIEEPRLGALFFPAVTWNPVLWKSASLDVFLAAVQEGYGVQLVGLRWPQ